MGTVLVVEGLRKAFAAVTALAGFDLTVHAGEVVGLIGHNASGKSTFARVVAGLVRPDQGLVRVGAGAGAGRRRGLVGLAPQEPALYRNATVWENLRLFGGLAGLRRTALRREVDAVAPALDLVGVLDRRVATLSGGQFRRVQAAAALLHRPPVLLLDEPTVGVDPQTRAALPCLLRERADEGAGQGWPLVPQLGAVAPPAGVVLTPLPIRRRTLVAVRRGRRGHPVVAAFAAALRTSAADQGVAGGEGTGGR